MPKDPETTSFGWSYLGDDNSTWHGPYSSKQLREWYEDGFLPLTLHVRFHYPESDIKDGEAVTPPLVLSEMGALAFQPGFTDSDDFHSVCVIASKRKLENGSGGGQNEKKRPPRRRKRKAVVVSNLLGGDSSNTESSDNLPVKRIPKDAETKASISQALRSNYLFAPLRANAIDLAVDAMEPQMTAQNFSIINQGDTGDSFFVLERGSVEFIVDGHVVGQAKAPATFGELALIYDSPRTASVRTKTNCQLWSITRTAFRRALNCASTATHLKHMKLLSSVPSFKDLSPNQITVIAGLLVENKYEDGDHVITQGDTGETFYIIESGNVKVDVQGVGIVATLKPGQFFGERALLTAEKRNASCIADGDNVVCLSLEKRHFESLLGDLKGVLEEISKKREDENRDGDNNEDTKSEKTKEVLHTIKKKEKREPVKKLSWAKDISEFEVTKKVGSGTFGVVRLAKHRKTERIVAIKCMQKMTIRKNKQIEAVLNECRSNQAMKHPFVNELLGTLQDTRYLYLFMNLIQGGELWGLLYQSRALPRSDTGGLKEKIARFYAAQVACAIAHIHERGYMYRDLKPENLMIGKKGYLRIVDFGFCKKTPPQGKKSMTLCGTPEYLSPELVLQKGHNQGVDWWAFGCLVFELLTSDTPFADNHQGRIFKKIVNAEKLIPYLFSRRFPRKARNLVELLLVPNPNLRLGMGRQGGNGVMKHEWFGGMDWKKLVGMKYKAPYRPRLENETDVVVDLDNEDEEAENSEGNVKEDLEIEFWKDFAVDVSDDDVDSKEDFG